MSEFTPIASPSLRERIHERFGARAGAIFLALLVELLLALLLLTLAPSILREEEKVVPMSTFGVTPEPEPLPDEKDPTPAKRSATDPDPVDTPPPVPSEVAPRPAEPPVRTLPLLDIPLSNMPDIAALPRRPAAPRSVAGPRNPGPAPGDSERVDGRGPNGEPLYGASRYRKPYDNELSGYLSSAQGPGWGRIMCRTVADYRVEDCVSLGEYPEGSKIARAVLAAAWQFRIRPPRVGGQSRVGEWVRIHIDYEMLRQSPPPH